MTELMSRYSDTIFKEHSLQLHLWSAQNLKCISIVCQCKCGLCDLCDRESDDEDSWLLFLLYQSRAIPKKNKFAYPFASSRAASMFKRKQMADGGSQTNQKLSGRPLEAAWRAFGESDAGSGVYSEENGSARALGGGCEWQSVRVQTGRGVQC